MSRLKVDHALKVSVLATVVARVLLVPALLVSASYRRDHRGQPYDVVDGLQQWDWSWYELIAASGYGPPPLDKQYSPWPFFPLYPGIVRVGEEVVGDGFWFAWVVSLVATVGALVGVHRLVCARSTRRAADVAVWLGALSPFGFAYVMGYPSALFLCATTWAAVLVDRRRWWSAGLLLGVATALRPNGITAAFGFAVVVLVQAVRARREPGALRSGLGRAVALGAPSVVLLAMWMGLLVRWTDSPITFLTSKDAWYEVDIIALLRGENLTSWAHVATALVGIGAMVGVAWWARRGPTDDVSNPSSAVDDPVGDEAGRGGAGLRERTPRRPDVMPAAWLVYATAYLAPAFVLGVHGTGRYACELFPVLAAGGIVIDGAARRYGRFIIPVLVGVSGLVMASLGGFVFAGRYLL